ncbi:hypothetical protein [Photobacterium damselae]|uniref:ORC-CDC6 family AAA ATPase n=1 Tax=Photobacterium damselae TaxID=38293 RepID=UPI001F20D152|nr:hypothetical protein [Photobacterium damselae]UKA09464.1 hypothetical protein IHC91_10585 [Photobacterium damselae subsp. damselae]
MNDLTINFNESFNAKATSKSNLCSDFIINSHYDLLTTPNNTIMIGPRGSGKTTLLRMLDVEVLEIWNKSIAENYRKKISYSGVFIPTDRFWKTQYERISSRFKGNSNVQKLLSASFIYHILECLAQVVSYRANSTLNKKNKYLNVEISKTDESELVQQLSEYWKVSPKIPSLRGLVIATSIKKQEISTLIASLNNEQDISEFDILEHSLVGILEVSTQIVNQYFCENDGKWAFLFDELELAPEVFIQPLIDAMRGGPQNIIFKLALSPYHKGISITKDSFSGMNKQDLTFINLSGVRDDGFAFARELSQNIFNKYGLVNEIESYFESDSSINRDLDLKELIKKDKSFYEYASRNKLNINSYDNLDENRQAVFRRIQFNIHLRNYYLKNDKAKSSRRRASLYYTGFKNICAMLEYNPRMLVGIMSTFASIVRKNGAIKEHEQLSNIRKYADSFKSLLSTIAVDSSNNEFVTLFDIIDKIGTYLKEEIHGSEFNPDPKGSIIFKNEYNENYISAIGLALNAGALIIEKSSIDSFHDIDDIMNERCRLSYLFAPEYRLLLNVQRPVDLIDILNHSHIEIVDPSGVRYTQKELF